MPQISESLRHPGRVTQVLGWLFLLLTLSAAIHGGEASDAWKPMPLLTPEQKAAGITLGGEGGQWPRGPIAVSPADPNFLLLPIDVGGLYRSLDGGKRWTIAMVGWHARGANGFSIDPKNAKRVIGISGNSLDWGDNWGPPPHGLYLSTDQASSWKQVLPLRGGFNGNVVHDATSFDAAKGYCTQVFYLSGQHHFYRSEDGGETWRELTNHPDPGRHPTGDWSLGWMTEAQLVSALDTGALFISGANGLHRSTDRGASWTTLRKEPVYSLAAAVGGRLTISGPDRLHQSSDNGTTWSTLAGEGLPGGDVCIQGLSQSPVDPQRLLCWSSGQYFVWPRFISHDGGARWEKIPYERDGAPLPLNGRQGFATWSPRDANVAWSIGGDWVIGSRDGGKTFQWMNNGYGGIMLGHSMAFSPTQPQSVFLGFQDYNGASTTDGGATWRYREVSGVSWGGHVYGGFALTPQVMWAGVGQDWNGPRQLRISRDGGTAWTWVDDSNGKPLELHGDAVSGGDPRDPLVGFAYDHRTADGGKTWAHMDGCEGVFAYHAQNGLLYGKRGEAVVTSNDHGATWTVLTSVPGGFSDLAVDHERNAVYAASQDHLKRFANGTWSTIDTPADQYGATRVKTVATDPVQPAIIYVGGYANVLATHAAVCRSTDRGQTWTNLTATTPLSRDGMGSPHEVGWIRVHPVTREAWAAGQCFGMWRIAPPKTDAGGKPAAEASRQRVGR
jgi:hypothetical protein